MIRLIETRAIVKDDITYQVRVEEDWDSKPFDADCYSDADIEAWRRDEWHYVGVIVTPVVAGIPIDAAEDSLWGVEWGQLPDLDRYLGMDQICNVHPVPEMLDGVRDKLKRFAPDLIEALSKLV
ncbi:hypothetical protein [Nonomuraea jabiensis]|uniref:hypothetical protein n=1 Tax=Nonomuraea jabiensis TaxID=882448 RepID=UPI003D74669D